MRRLSVTGFAPISLDQGQLLPSVGSTGVGWTGARRNGTVARRTRDGRPEGPAAPEAVGMGDGFQFIDIIFFAMIAAFLALRLRSVLGRRDGHEGGFRDPFKPAPEKKSAREDGAEDKVVRLPDRRDEAADEAKIAAAAHGDETLASGLTQIKLADSAFEPDGFASGARIAFEMITDAFAKGDAAALKGMLSVDVLANFTQAIKAREEGGESTVFTLVGIRSAEIVEAYMEGRNATVTVKFVSEQINATRDRDGNVVSGDPTKVVDVTDFWTFQRDTRSRDPNWTLVATRSLE